MSGVVQADSAETEATRAFRTARDFLLEHRIDYAHAYAGFRWPQLAEFNWALDWFDIIAADNHRPALRIVGQDHEESVSFADLAARSNQVASWLRACGIRRGDRVVLLLGTSLPLWETLLAIMKLGAVAVPLPSGIPETDLGDRLRRSRAAAVIADARNVGRLSQWPAGIVRVAVGEPVPTWRNYAEAEQAPTDFTPDGPTRGTDPLMVYFTSGTTSRPKLVEHTHVSYPVGHLSSLYFNGLIPGDVHLNVSDPGWAKHSWSSLFVPWTAEATIVAVESPRGSGAVESRRILDLIAGIGVTSVCAPPRVWRALVQAGLGARPVSVREATSAGEQLDPGVVATVEEAWGVTIRDGYGQTETTAQIGNTPGQLTRPGAVGRPLPGYRIVLLDPATGQEADEGEICVEVTPDFPALMRGYDDVPRRTTAAGHGGRYRTGDLGRRDGDGHITVLGRVDDVFQFDGHRVSPAEIESVLVTHPAVADAAVVGVADGAGDRVAQAFVVPTRGTPPSLATAAAIFGYSRVGLAPHARVRRVVFVPELPKTASGKIRRAALRDPAAVVIESEFLEGQASDRGDDTGGQKSQ